MTITCFFLGCRWGAGTVRCLTGERLLVFRCNRCGSHRTVTE
ncbi:PSPA7_2676 family Cys-rich small protein [Pseudomonas cavernicola]